MKSVTKTIVSAAVLVAGVAFAATMPETGYGAPQRAGDTCTLSIPGELTLKNNDATVVLDNVRVTEHSDGNPTDLGYFQQGGGVTFKNVHCTKAGVYNFIIPLDFSFGTGTIKIEVTDNATNTREAVYDGVLTKNNSKYENVAFPLEGIITEGCKTVKFVGNDTQHNYVCNMYSPSMEWISDGATVVDPGTAPEGWPVIPGSIEVDQSWTYGGGARYESGGPNVGYNGDGSWASHDFFCNETGVYRMKWNIPWKQNSGYVNITVKDKTTNRTEINTNWDWDKNNSLGDYEVLLEGLITAGKKEIKITTHCDGGYLLNWKTPTFTKVADEYAAVEGVTIEGVEATELEGFDYSFNLPIEYSASTVALKADYQGGTLEAKVGDQTVNGTDGVFEIATPAANAETVVDLTLTPNQNAVSNKTQYKVRIYHIGDVQLTDLTVDGVAADAAILTALNENAAANIAGNIYTQLPKVAATFVDGSSAQATVTVADGVATAKFTGKAGDITKEFTLTVEGIHIYTPTADDQTVSIRFDSANNDNTANTWSDGLYTLNSATDGWGGTQFKFRSNTAYTWTVPADVVVKQFKLMSLFDNYAPGKVKYVTASGADAVWVPTNTAFVSGGPGYDLIINLEGHKAGTPITFEFEGGSQPVAWFDFVYTKQTLTTAPKLLNSETTPTEHANHANVILTFDREVLGATATVGSQTVTAEGGSSQLVFPVWNLEWSTDYELVIAAGAVKDTYGNVTTEDIKVAFSVGTPAPAVAIDTDHFVIVSNAEELKAAVAQANQTNKSSDAKQFVIFLRNGDYQVGTEKISGHHLHINRAYNVSLIGESREGVIIHAPNDGISNGVVSTRYSTNVYIENLTIRNDLDYNAVIAGGDRVGVGCAFYGGNKDILKDVTLQSVQDTYVTGELGYHKNVQIEGSVDYICGGGNHFFDGCTIVNLLNGGAVTAPSTMASCRWGYVFSGCTIKGQGNYALGRPWQNEPRAYYLNTVMEAKASEGGWAGMSDPLPTHFYEYNSVDKDGNLIDLSKRTNSSTSTNTYTPVLTDAEAALFTVENVLGGNDSWYAPELTTPLGAPQELELNTDEGLLSWAAVEGAAGYLVYKDGNLVEFVADTEYAIPAAPTAAPAYAAAEPVYTVRALSSHGALGEMSQNNSTTTGIADIMAEGIDADATYYNLNGVRLQGNVKGLVIKVSADGTASKVIVK